MKGPGKGWAVMGRTAVRGGGGGCCNTEPIEWGRGGGDSGLCCSCIGSPPPHFQGAGAVLANLSSCIYYY